MFLLIRIDHEHIDNPKIWIGWKNDSTSHYTQTKIWNREGGNADHLAINVRAKDFRNTHDWRLRVYDAVEGDNGRIITDFSIP